MAKKLLGIVGLLTLMGGTAMATPLNYSVALTPENGSGVTGTADLVLNGDFLTVTVNAVGLVPNQLHMFHIHGLLGASAPLTQPAPPSADTNHDGYVDTAEAVPFAGPPLYNLPENPATLSFPTAPGGVVSFTQTYDLRNTALYNTDFVSGQTENDILGLTGGETVPLADRLLELHGIMTPLGYNADLPAAGGKIVPAPEPGSLALAGAGLAGLFLARRKGGLAARVRS